MLEQVKKLPPEKRREVLRLLKEKADLQKYNAWDSYRPYRKQLEFHHSPARERLFEAGNQLGKTLAGGMEVAYHLTGKYPSWWKGRRFNQPTKWWVAGESGETTRDNIQRILLGDIGEWGTGCIPKDLLGKRSLARGVADLVDHVEIKHEKGKSHLSFLSYGKGREKFQGETVSGIWFDEQPPMDVYSEGLTRTSKVLGPCLVTFTPLEGVSGVVFRFHGEDSPGRSITQMTIWDVVEEGGHYTKEDAEKVVESYPEHEREARAEGKPMLGSGLIFQVPESRIRIESDYEIPTYWPQIIGMDFGWGDHPTAAIKAAWDRDSDKLVLIDEYRRSEKSDIVAHHAEAIRAMGGSSIPVAWPHDGKLGNRADGKEVKEMYRDHGLNMLYEHATFADGGFGREPSIQRIYERMKTGRLLIMGHLTMLFDELRMYHRKDGRVVDVRDDLISAMRYAEMMLRYAREPGQGRYQTHKGPLVYDDRLIV